MISGVLLLDKKSGPTSHTCVDQVRKVVNMRNVGHFGTLDPRAKGLLPLCIGSTTKLSSLLFTDEKKYHFSIRLGISTNTQDMDGEINQEMEVPSFSNQNLEEISKEFTQKPYFQQTPEFSARKVNGKKLYQYARSGLDVPKIPPRPVQIHSLNLTKINRETIEGELHCGTGTYVRQMVVDIAEKLGTCGVLFDLTRTQVGHWKLSDAVSIEEIQAEAVLNPFFNGCPYFIPSHDLLKEIPRFDLTPGLWHQLKNGVQPIHFSLFDVKNPPGEETFSPSGLGQGDLICGLIKEKEEKRLGALLAVHFIRNQKVTCRLHKLLP